MKRTKILYWVFTGLLAALMLLSGIPDVLVVPDAITIVKTHLGYPQYIIPFLGVAKVLAAIVIIIPGFPRLKEWAYAGIVFDLGGALYSAIAVGDPISQWWSFSIMFALIAASYIFYHKKMKLVK